MSRSFYMTNYQMIIDTINSQLFKVWQNGYNQQPWNEENAKEVSNTILRQVEQFKMNQIDGGKA